MITQARIEQELRGIEGLEWIGALRSSQIAGLLEEGAIAASLFDEKNLAKSAVRIFQTSVSLPVAIRF